MPARRAPPARALPDIAAYRDYLETHPHEWQALDDLCAITISCFYRDTAMWEALTAEVLPELARRAVARGAHSVQAASLGCASGEEPYTLTLAWQFALAPQFPGRHLEVTATDVVEAVLERARAPATWRPTSSCCRRPGASMASSAWASASACVPASARV